MHSLLLTMFRELGRSIGTSMGIEADPSHPTVIESIKHQNVHFFSDATPREDGENVGINISHLHGKESN